MNTIPESINASGLIFAATHQNSTNDRVLSFIDNFEMNLRPEQWCNELDRILKTTPTLVGLFGSDWFESEKQSFQHATHQYGCHPLVSLLVHPKSSEPEQFGYDSAFLEQMFARIKSDIKPSKIKDIKNRRNWGQFNSVFGELLYAYLLVNTNLKVQLEPVPKGTIGPDIKLSSPNIEIGLEVCAIVENPAIQKANQEYRDELSDALTLSRLVTEYRDARSKGIGQSPQVTDRLAEVEYYDSIWETPSPNVFGGVRPLTRRFNSSEAAYQYIRDRKKDAKQVGNSKFGILGLVMPTEYFPFPNAYKRISKNVDPNNEKLSRWSSGVVYNSFFGMCGEPIYFGSICIQPNKRPSIRKVIDGKSGRFMIESKYGAAIICSLATSQGRITTPITYNFIIYEPFGFRNLKKLIPVSILQEIRIALGANDDFSRFVSRTPFGKFRNLLLYEAIRRKFDNT